MSRVEPITRPPAPSPNPCLISAVAMDDRGNCMSPEPCQRKGLWVGGMAPLGYETKERKIVVVEEEAERVRTIPSAAISRLAASTAVMAGPPPAGDRFHQGTHRSVRSPMRRWGPIPSPCGSGPRVAAEYKYFGTVLFELFKPNPTISLLRRRDPRWPRIGGSTATRIRIMRDTSSSSRRYETRKHLPRFGLGLGLRSEFRQRQFPRHRR